MENLAINSPKVEKVAKSMLEDLIKRQVNGEDVDKDRLQFLMLSMKIITLSKHLTYKEIEELYGCDYEFTVECGRITMLEIWHNPNGKHDYKDKYRKEFKIT